MTTSEAITPATRGRTKLIAQQIVAGKYPGLKYHAIAFETNTNGDSLKMSVCRLRKKSCPTR